MQNHTPVVKTKEQRRRGMWNLHLRMQLSKRDKAAARIGFFNLKP